MARLAPRTWSASHACEFGGACRGGNPSRDNYPRPSANYAPCRCGLSPGGDAIAQHWLTPLARLFEARGICCHKCGLPVCGLSVERHVHNGGSMREDVHAWWVPGSPSDPVVVAFWRGVRGVIAGSSG